MKRLIMRALVALGVLTAFGAWADDAPKDAATKKPAPVVKGGTLYIKDKDTKLLSKPDLGASGPKLKQGDAVTWQGPSDKNPQIHAVEQGKKKGFVIQSALAVNKPLDEIPKSDGKSMSAEAFKSSGAATKAMTEAGLKYAAGKDPAQAPIVAAGVIHLEGSSEDEKSKVKDLVKKNGLGGEK